ncbi:unnamed protein product, partial [Ceratitis capitata]
MVLDYEIKNRRRTEVDNCYKSKIIIAGKFDLSPRTRISVVKPLFKTTEDAVG